MNGITAILSAGRFDPEGLLSGKILSLPRPGQPLKEPAKGLRAAGLALSFASGGPAAAQPVRRNGFLFAHNGTFAVSSEILTVLGKYRRFVKGGSGPEILFWQIMKMLDAYGDPALALEMAVDEIRTVWLGRGNRRPGKKAPFDGLTIFLGNAGALWVLSGPGAGRIVWREDARKVVFSGRPGGGENWRTLPADTMIETRIRGRAVDTTIKRYS